MYARVHRINALDVLGVVIVLAALYSMLIPNFVEAAPQCRDGKLYDTVNGQEIQVGTCPDGNATPTGNNSLLRDGIFGCNASKYANIGTITAVGGVYVPVNDAAVTINTGYLVYKECILDGVVAKISEAARTDLAGNILKQITTARSGEALYVKKFWPELKNRADKVVVVTASEESVGVMCPVFKNQVRTVKVRRYLADNNAPNQAFACSFPDSAGDQQAALSGNVDEDDVLEAIGAFSVPGNDPYSAYLIYDEYVDSAVAADRYYQTQQWSWGNGFYSVTDESDNPFDEEIFTPGYLVAQGAGQAVTSGFRCLEGADELSEVCAPMFSGLSTQVIADARGLTGLSQSASGIPSYINRMISEAGAAVRQEAVNAALNILVTARQIEALYKQAKEGIVNVLTSAINRLRTAEKKCWELIIEKVCTSPPGNDKRCPAVGGGTLRVATSTEFSQEVIDAQIGPVALIAAEDLKKSEAALQKIDQIIASVTNSSSATGQRQALEQLDSMVANGLLHTASQAQNANKQLEDVTSSANTLVEDTLKAWGDSTDPNVGWCNVNNQSVIQMWIDRWKM